MNRDEITRLITESIAEGEGIDIKEVLPPPEYIDEVMPVLEVFVNKLLQAGAAAERKECADICARIGSTLAANKIRQRQPS